MLGLEAFKAGVSGPGVGTAGQLFGGGVARAGKLSSACACPAKRKSMGLAAEVLAAVGVPEAEVTDSALLRTAISSGKSSLLHFLSADS